MFSLKNFKNIDKTYRKHVFIKFLDIFKMFLKISFKQRIKMFYLFKY